MAEQSNPVPTIGLLEQVNESESDDSSFFDDDGGDKVEINDNESRSELDTHRMAQVLVSGKNTYENCDGFIDEYRSELYASELMSEFGERTPGKVRD